MAAIIWLPICWNDIGCAADLGGTVPTEQRLPKIRTQRAEKKMLMEEEGMSSAGLLFARVMGVSKREKVGRRIARKGDRAQIALSIFPSIFIYK